MPRTSHQVLRRIVEASKIQLVNYQETKRPFMVSGGLLRPGWRTPVTVPTVATFLGTGQRPYREAGLRSDVSPSTCDRFVRLTDR
jgi:hypothetical protein